jgi:hypothetical protein
MALIPPLPICSIIELLVRYSTVVETLLGSLACCRRADLGFGRLGSAAAMAADKAHKELAPARYLSPPATPGD